MMVLRRRLEPLWLRTHQEWGEVPDPLSRWMCRHTAEFVALLDPSWVPVMGWVDGETHVWSERDGLFLDLTGDQFGLPPVQLASARPAGYTVGAWTDAPSDRYRARARGWLATPPSGSVPPAAPVPSRSS